MFVFDTLEASRGYLDGSVEVFETRPVHDEDDTVATSTDDHQITRPRGTDRRRRSDGRWRYWWFAKETNVFAVMKVCKH